MEENQGKIKKVCMTISIILLLLIPVWAFILFPNTMPSDKSLFKVFYLRVWIVPVLLLFYSAASFFVMFNLKGGKDKSKALTSFILGLVLWVPLFNVMCGVIGLIFGIIALKEIKKNPEEYEGKTLATVGIVLCAIPVVGSILYFGALAFGVKF